MLTRFSTDLVRWPRFLPQVTQFRTWPRIIKTNILSKVHDECLKKVTARVLTKFFSDLAWWPSFLPYMTQFQTWPRNHQGKHFGHNSWWSLQKCDLWCVKKVSPLIWLGDLVFDPKWPSFKLDLEIIKANILSKIHDVCFINVTARELTRIYTDVAGWPSFWPHVTQFRTWPRNHNDKHLNRFMMIASKVWPLACQQGFLLIWAVDLVFYPKWPSFELELELSRQTFWARFMMNA